MAVLLTAAGAWSRGGSHDATPATKSALPAESKPSGRLVRVDAASAAVGSALAFADELRLTYAQREELEQLEDEQGKRQLSGATTERRLRTVLSDEQFARFERLRGSGVN